MNTLLDLPNDLIHIIIDNLPTPSINSLILTHPRFITYLTPILYRRNADAALHWASRIGQLNTAQKALLANASINCTDTNYMRETPLVTASKMNHHEIVELLLKQPHIDLNAADRKGYTALLWAGRRGRNPIARMLISRPDALVNTQEADGYTPLLWAAERGFVDIARWLIERPDTDVNLCEKRGFSAIHWAARNGALEIVSALLGRDEVVVGRPDKESGMTPLAWAALGRHMEVARALMDRRDASDGLLGEAGEGCSTLLMAAIRGGHEGMVNMVLQSGFGAVEELSGALPFSVAVEMGHEAVARFILEKTGGRVDVDKRDSTNRTPLMKAAANGHAGVVRILLETCGDRIDINAKDSKGRTPLAIACSRGKIEVTRLLMNRRDVDIGLPDSKGRTAIFHAAMQGYIKAVKILLAKEGLDKDAITTLSDALDGVDEHSSSDGVSPAETFDYNQLAMVASKYGHTDVVRFFLEMASAKEQFETESASTPQGMFWTAAEQGHTPLVEMLLAREDVVADKKMYDGRTAFSRAVCTDDLVLCKMLASRDDVDPDARDNGGYSPLYWAARYGSAKVAAWMLEHKLGDPYERLNDNGNSAWRYVQERGLQGMMDVIQKWCPNEEIKRIDWRPKVGAYMHPEYQYW